MKKISSQTIASLLVATFVFAMFTTAIVAMAGSGHSISGWAWGGGVTTNPHGYQGMGYISLNSMSSPIDYGVHAPNPGGPVTGYAWSEHYGWISFNGTDLAGCVPTLQSAKRETDGSITGGARILSIRSALANSNAGGFDGCISLSGANYGVRINNDKLSGYAWSSDLGWINMSSSALIICPESVSVAVGGKDNLIAKYWSEPTVTPDCSTAGGMNVTDSSVWDSSHDSLATINNTTSKGEVTGVAVGNPIMTAQYSGITATRPVTVNSANLDLEARDVGIGFVTTGTNAGITGLYQTVNYKFFMGNVGNVPVVTSPIPWELSYTSDPKHTTYGNPSQFINPPNSTYTGSHAPPLPAGDYADLTNDFSSVPFGKSKVCAEVNMYDNLLDGNESNTANNKSPCAEIYLPVPEPPMSIYVYGGMNTIRRGETVTLNYEVKAEYPSLECRVFGPGGVSPVPFTPANDPSGVYSNSTTTAPLTSKSEFLLRCTERVTGTVFDKTTIVEVVPSQREN